MSMSCGRVAAHLHQLHPPGVRRDQSPRAGVAPLRRRPPAQTARASTHRVRRRGRRRPRAGSGRRSCAWAADHRPDRLDAHLGLVAEQDATARRPLGHRASRPARSEVDWPSSWRGLTTTRDPGRQAEGRRAPSSAAWPSTRTTCRRGAAVAASITCCSSGRPSSGSSCLGRPHAGAAAGREDDAADAHRPSLTRLALPSRACATTMLPRRRRRPRRCGPAPPRSPCTSAASPRGPTTSRRPRPARW